MNVDLAVNGLFSGAPCRRKDGVSARGAAEDRQRWNQDSGHHPLSD